MFTSACIIFLSAAVIPSNGHPIDPKVVLPVTNGFGIAIVGAALLITSIVALVACACCKQRRDGFKPNVEEVMYKEEFRNPGTGHIGFTNSLSSELAIFPPAVTAQHLHQPPVPAETHGDINPPSRPAAFSCAVPSVTDWFGERNVNFPRQQLFYQKEIGKGWFGKVVKGEARGAKVVVRILREDATAEEKGYFLHEARPFRDLKHRNISRLYARCLEHDPFLLLFEYCTNGDLKSFLVTNSGSRNAITEQKISLKMMIDVTEGLKFMNEHGFIHTDLAARNCLVASDLTVKIGDYGTSVDKYKNEYYIVGDVAVPIRWCAPETLTCTQTTIETKQVTEGGNVWSLAVLLWEIAEFGKMPYSDLADDQVITRVLVQGCDRLPPPNCSFGHYLHNIMTLCWRVENRANIEQILSMLIYLKTNPFQESDFEARWKMLKPNTVAIVDNHTPIHSPRHTELAQRPHLTAKHEFDSGVDLEIKPTDENPDSCRTSTPTIVSPQLSSEEIFQPAQLKSPSLTNLKGSFEDVAQFDSWLMGVEQKTEEDRKFVKNISEAIKNLDETLALEKTSSSSQDSSMEDSKKPLLDFKLGPTGNERRGDSSSSDTEEETWRNRIERGEFTEKVKEKSKSVTDLMVLTHIDSEGSESDSLPSLTRQYSSKKITIKGVSYTGIGFGSEGNIRNAVLSEELQDKLKRLASWKTETQSFLVKGASEKNNKNTFLEEVKDTSITPEESAPPSADFNFSLEGEESIINSMSTTINKESVMSDKESVNSNCTKSLSSPESEPVVISSVGSNVERVIDRGSFDSNMSVSSHSSDNAVPKIVITESELPLSPEPEPVSSDTQHLVNIKPRKFVFVCKDLDPLTVENKMESSDEKDVKTTDAKIEEASASSVILGSCEEHTLDYFKGLKTTFTPLICYPDDSENLLVGDNESDSAEDHSRKEESDLERYLVGTILPAASFLDLSEQSEDLDTVESNIAKESLILEKKNFVNKPEVKSDNSQLNESSLLINEMNFNSFDESILNTVSSFINNERFLTSVCDSISSEQINTSSQDPPRPTEEEKMENETSAEQESAVSPVKIDSSRTSKNCSQEHLVEAPYPFNEPEPADVQSNITSIKAKSLDSFLSPKNGFEHFVTLRNGIYVEDDSMISNFVPVFNMTESVSENTFMSQNLYYDPYFSVDSGHSSDRCVEQDKKMNDLKSRLEDVVKAGNDFQLKNSEEEYGGKLMTPDDERSSDSGFRDKGSLSESVEDTCDEKYNLEDIDAELDDYTIKNMDKEDLKYYEQLTDSDQNSSSGWFLHVKNGESKDSGWLSQSTEDDQRSPLTIDAEFAAAIRNELKEKLPCVQQVEKAEEDTSPEQEPATDKFTYPSQLSPIMEEQESNQSSLQLNDFSPVFILPPPDIKADNFNEDIVKAFESLESSKNGIIIEDLECHNGLMVFNEDKIILDDDVLIVDTETNEATLIESPKPQTHLAFVLAKKEPEPEAYISDDSPEINSDIYILTPDNAPLTPNSVNSDSHSSPENENMSGLFLSPCSVRSDLFDSGPPSLPFDLGQSLEEVEDIPAGEETVFENPASHIDQNNDNLFIYNGNVSDEPLDNLTDYFKVSDIEVIDNILVDIENNEAPKDFPDKRHEPEPDENLKTKQEQIEKFNDIKVILNPCSPDSSKILQNSVVDNKHLKAEVEIDKLLSSSAVENEVENTNHMNSSTVLRNDWLKDLFTNNTKVVELQEKEDEKQNYSNLQKHDWPTIEELILERTEQNNCLKPNITSTLALMSPDLSSTESKSLASTPSSDENKTVLTSTEDSDSSRVSKPTTLSLRSKSDVSGAPMPSPEDAEPGWRPTMGQLMELTDQAAAEGEEMTTSFIEPDENGIYTPDWESDISEEQSSSSGEFVWKEGDKEDLIKCLGSEANSLNEDLVGGGMDRIEEEDEECSSCSSEASEASSGAEFVPSTWNAMAIPLKPAIRTNPSQKKGMPKRVVFKKEKYQCMYEYPREESDNEEEDFSPAMWETPTTPVFDYSVFVDWELGEGEISTPIDSVVDPEAEEFKKPNNELDFDIYQVDYNTASSQAERPWSDSLPEDDSEFSPLASDLAPVRLGDLRHTKATLRLELPQLRPDQGEASILDPPL